jgi:hypothetical protein
MKERIKENLRRLSSKKVMERKEAIKALARLLHHQDAYLVRLSLHYVSLHDPSYTVRNLARQAFYRIGEPPSADVHSWERAYLF